MNLQLARSRKPKVAGSYRVAVLPALSALRMDWEAAAEGESLIHVNASVGLLLLDIATNLGLHTGTARICVGGTALPGSRGKSSRTLIGGVVPAATPSDGKTTPTHMELIRWHAEQ